MVTSCLVTEVIGVGSFQLDWMPTPGNLIELEGNLYRVLERKHSYRFQKGKYHLHKMLLQVQKVDTAQHHSAIGDPTCQFNARSELLRCAINPIGPCHGCTHYRRLGG